MSDQFRYVGATSTDLEGGRPIGPGECTGPIDVSEDAPKNKQLLDDGLLIKLPPEVVKDNEDKSAKAEAEAKAEAQAAAKAEAENNSEGTKSTSTETAKDGDKS